MKGILYITYIQKQQTYKKGNNNNYIKVYIIGIYKI